MSRTRPRTIIFVYGTLKRGFAGHAPLRGSTFLKTAQTTPGYTLYDSGEWPAMVAHGNGSVSGELFEIPFQTLKALDTYEGHPDLFRRTTIKLADHPAEAWLYARDIPPQWPVIPEGCWQGLRAP